MASEYLARCRNCGTEKNMMDMTEDNLCTRCEDDTTFKVVWFHYLIDGTYGVQFADSYQTFTEFDSAWNTATAIANEHWADIWTDPTD